MSIKKLSLLALEKLKVYEVERCNSIQLSVVSAEILEAVKQSDGLQMFKKDLESVEFHPCRLGFFNVWHGKRNRKFRRITDCLSCCDGEGTLCKCWCGSILKKLIEFREAEIFRGKGKQPKKVIKKNQTIGAIIDGSFQQFLPKSIRF